VDQADCEATVAAARCTAEDALISEVYVAGASKGELGPASFVMVRNVGSEACSLEGWAIDTKKGGADGKPSPDAFVFGGKAVVPAMAVWKADVAKDNAVSSAVRRSARHRLE
jgi:hypothetical protein